MKKMIFFFAACVLLFPALAFSAPGKQDRSDETANKVRDVQLLNLINGLELTKAQKELVVIKAREAAAIRATYELAIAKNETEFVSVISELRSVLLKGGSASEELRKRLNENKKARTEIDEKLENETMAIAREVEKSLDGRQKYALEHYKPCLIPPDTANIGQADEPGGFLKKLDKLRAMTQQEYTKKRMPMAFAAYKRVKTHLPPGTDLDEEGEIEFYVGFFDKVRAMDEPQYLLKKKELAGELAERYKPKYLPLTLVAKTKNLLLDPRIPELVTPGR